MNKHQTASSPTVRKSLIILVALFAISIFDLCSWLKNPANQSPPALVTAPVISAQDAYYVDNNMGSDANPGTQSQPWKSIQKAADTAMPGKTILVQAGTYDENVKINASGMSSARLVFQANGNVVTQGFTVNANYVTINGFEITNKVLDFSGWGIYLNGSNNLVENNYIHDTTWGGVMVFANMADPTLSTNNVVQHNKIYHVGQMGIDLRGRDNIAQYNDISYVMQYPAWLTNPPSWADADGIHFHGQGHILRGNYIHDISYSQPENKNPHIDCFQSFADANHEAASNIVIEQNRCDNDFLAHSTGEGGSGFTIADASDIIIRNNLVDAFVNVFLVNDTSISILNNTMIGNLSQNVNLSPTGVQINAGTTNTVVENNIFYNQPGNIIYVKGAQPVSGRNIIYRNDGQPIYSNDTYNPINDLWDINPLFVDSQNGDYHLQAGSPAIDAGDNLGVSVPNDFVGTLRPQGKGYDIGAYEYAP